MQLYLNRYDATQRGITGLLYIDGSPYGFTVERPWKDNQKSVSCIPEGKYKVKFREDPTPLTMHYRQKYDYFNFHLELQDVKDRSGIYIHVGNKPEDVEGCIAVAREAGAMGSNFIKDSRKAFKPFYMKCKAALQRGEKISITIDSKRL